MPLLEIAAAANLLFFGVAAVLFLARLVGAARVTFREAYASGYRAALREGIRIANVRGDIAIELAPNGRLGQGLLRAQIAHEVALELAAKLEAIR